MKVNSIGVIPPSIPSARSAKPSFGHEVDEEVIERDVDTQDCFEEECRKPEYMDEWAANKRDFEKLAKDSENPKFVNKLGKAGILLASGILTYGTARIALQQVFKTSAHILKSKSVLALRAKASKFFTETVAPNAKKAAEFVAESKVGTAAKDKYNKFATKEGVAPKIEVISNKGTQLKTWFNDVKSRITKDKIKTVTIEAISIGSGLAGTVTGANIAHEHQKMKDAA